MRGDAVQPDIHCLIEEKQFGTLKSALRDMEIHDLTELIASLTGEDQAVAFRLLPLERATEVFGDLPNEDQEKLFQALSGERFSMILNELPPDERTDFLEELPGEIAQRLLSTLRGEERQIAVRLMAYPEESIGRLMTPEYVAVQPDWTVEHVLRQIRSVAAKKETIDVIYVTDPHSKLLDDIPLKDLVLAEPEARVEDLMDHLFASLHASDDRESTVELFKKYEAVALPVVNSQGVLVGIVTVDDVLDVAEEEDTEDFQKITGMDPLEGSYFATGLVGMMSKRLPWLLLLLGAETVAVVVLYRFEKMLAILAMFMPLINATAGNTGNQVAGLMIRGFAVREVQLGDWWRVLVREVTRGVVLGLVLAVVAFTIVHIFEPDAGLRMAKGLASGAAMLIVVTMANLLGSMLPFFFKRVGVDPAVTSGPFIASVMDVASILVFFTSATFIIRAAT